jgi:hypothetical protein
VNSICCVVSIYSYVLMSYIVLNQPHIDVNYSASTGILMAIAGLPVLPSIILGVNVTTVTTFSAKNVSSSNYIYITTSNADIRVQYGTS